MNSKWNLNSPLSLRAGIPAAMILAAGMLGACMDGNPSHSHEADKPQVNAPDKSVSRADQPVQATPGEAAYLEEILKEKTLPAIPEVPAGLAKSAHHGDCNVNFNQRTALQILPDYAANTFAVNPWYIHTCNSGYGFAHVREYNEIQSTNYNHYHLMYEKGNWCFPSGGGNGYMSGSTCVKVNDASLEPRNLYTHTGTQWIRMYVYKSGNPAMKFDLKQITVLGSNPIQLWVKKVADNKWYYWSSLTPGVWNMPYANEIKDIAIRVSEGYTTTYGMDNLNIHIPYQ
jgi:hypothetical protein